MLPFNRSAADKFIRIVLASANAGPCENDLLVLFIELHAKLGMVGIFNPSSLELGEAQLDTVFCQSDLCLTAFIQSR